MGEGGDIFRELLTSRTYVDDVPLSCPSCADSEELGIPGEVLELGEDRAGILTHKSWLIAFSRNDSNDPVGRGRFIRERLLCTQVPSVPPGVIPQLPEAQEDATMRESVLKHMYSPIARGVIV